jgi:multidrug efflux system outer membrane protein
MMRDFKAPRRLAGATLLTLFVTLAGCSLAPTYQAPHMLLPASYKGSGPFGLANPEAQLEQGDWWKMFGDEKLDGLEASLNTANPDLQAAEETYTQARDIVGEARSQLFPQLSAQTFATENRQSEDRLFRVAGRSVGRLRGGLVMGAGLLGRDPQSDELRKVQRPGHRRDGRIGALESRSRTGQ